MEPIKQAKSCPVCHGTGIRKGILCRSERQNDCYECDACFDKPCDYCTSTLTSKFTQTNQTQLNHEQKI
jgi:RecJ-like exonuclease